MARWLALCGLLCSGMMTGCVGEVDLQVLRADMETLQHRYHQHDAQLARQLEVLEMRMAKSGQELSPVTSTIVELRAEMQRLHTMLQEVRDTHNVEVTDEMQEKLAQLETRLAQVKRLVDAKKKPAVKRKKPKPAPSQPVARKQAPKERPVAKRKKPQPAAPSKVTVAKAVEAEPVKPSSEALEPDKPVASAETAKTAKSDSIKSQPATPQPSAASPTPPSDDTDVRLYERGLRAYQVGDYESALEFLRYFLNKHSQSSLAGNVQYWIGESLFAQRQYKAAIVAFDHVVQKYPNDTKVPAAMLNQGLAFAKLRDVPRARFFLQQVQEKYADSLEADQATATLQEMKQ